MSETDIFTLEAKKAFIYLRITFTKVPIFWHFNLECPICMETDASGYAISGVLNQMTLDQLFSNFVIHKGIDSSKSEIG